MRPEQIEGDMWLLCKRRWVKAERRRIRVRPSVGRRYLKKWARRLMRRLARTQMDDAPRRVPYEGYEW